MPEAVLLDRFVAGRPATFATAGERPWKAVLQAQLADATPDPRAAFIALDFVVAPVIGYARGADLDNFCEPVFSIVVKALGWFGRRRPGIRAFRAHKTLGEPTGCQVQILSERWQDLPASSQVVVDATWYGPLPLSARDEAFASWAREHMTGAAEPGHDVAVDLRFSGPVNLGDVATGRIKNVVDCLYPVLGGWPGAPNDSVVTSLEATRDDPGVAGTVAVVVSLLDRAATLSPATSLDRSVPPPGSPASILPAGLAAARDGRSLSIEDAIREAFDALGGVRSIPEISYWIGDRYPGRWKDISTTIADLTYPGSRSSMFPAHRRFLERVARGRYRLRG